MFELKHLILCSRAALRLRRSTLESRAIHRQRIAAYEAELRRRGVEPPGRGEWRQYPRTLQFGFTGSPSTGIAPVEPPPRTRKKDPAPLATPPNQLMSALEASLGQQMRNGRQR